MNKVLPEKTSNPSPIPPGGGFERLGLELPWGHPGAINMLEQSTLEQICEDIRGHFFFCIAERHDRNRVAPR